MGLTGLSPELARQFTRIDVGLRAFEATVEILCHHAAEIYSSSSQLHTYTMANFLEPHSISGIIGVPPGYVGFDQGGRLINELKASGPLAVSTWDSRRTSELSEGRAVFEHAYPGYRR